MDATSGLIDTSAGQVFWRRSGQGSPVVLVHGFMMAHQHFDPILEGPGGLCSRHEVVVLDLPGFGRSDCPSPQRFAYDLPAYAGVLAEVIDGLGLDRPALLGHSMGGGIVLQLALERQQRISRVVAVAASIDVQPLAWIARFVLVPGLGSFAWNHLMSRKDLAKRYREGVKDPRVMTDAFIDHCLDSLDRPGGRAATRAALRTLAALGASDARAVAAVQVPVLFVWGEGDVIVPVEHGRQLAAALPRARLEVLSDCWHHPFVERPDAFLQLLLPFLAEPQASVTGAA